MLIAHDAGDKESSCAVLQLLWKEQQSALLQGRGHRWHPAIIRWCLSIYLRSHSTYEGLRSSGMLLLPGATTLKRHAQDLRQELGITPERVDLLHKHGQQLVGMQRWIMLSIDGMSIQVRHTHQPDSGASTWEGGHACQITQCHPRRNAIVACKPCNTDLLLWLNTGRSCLEQAGRHHHGHCGWIR